MGGSMLVVEYEGIEPEDFYHNHSSTEPYDPDFYMSESLKKGPGLYDIEVHQGTPLE